MMRVNRKGRLYFLALRKLRALASAQLRRKKLKFNKNALHRIKSCRQRLRARKRLERLLKRKLKKRLSAQLRAKRLLERRLREQLKRRPRRRKKRAKRNCAKLRLKRGVQSARRTKKRTLKLPKLVKRGQLIIVRLMGLENAQATYGRKFAINHQ